MKKKKKKKVKKSIKRTFLFLICIVICVVTIISVTNVWSSIYVKSKEKNALDSDLKKLEKEEASLKLDVEKMQDPEYVARYLREKFFYSKKGEYVIRIPD